MLSVEKPLAALTTYVVAERYRGWDPYDALSARRFRWLLNGSRLARIGVTQILRRSPINLRAMLGVPKDENAKGLGLFLEGMSKLLQMYGDEGHRAECDYLLGRLSALSSPEYPGASWGYPFPWQSRAAYVPRGTPTIVNTSFIGHALLDFGEVHGSEEALELASRIPAFMLNALHRSSKGREFCFSYTPVDRNFVHNANLLGASFLARAAKALGKPELLDPAAASASYTIQRQRDDGSWPYAETKFQGWVDSFHTAFNLEALRRISDCGVPVPAMDAIGRGKKFYVDNFFDAEGAVWYYADRKYPLDIHSPTAAIAYLSQEADCRELLDRTVSWFLRRFYVENGKFAFRVWPGYRNTVPYMRWSHAWAFRALTCAAFRSIGAIKNEQSG